MMNQPRALTFAALLLFGCIGLVRASPALSADQPADPAPPVGSPVKGTPVALLGYGVDYTRPEIAAKLARDGEGEPIAWDFADNDARPYATSGHGTSDALLLATQTGTALLILVRQAASDPAAVGHMIAFAMRTPARIVIWPDADPRRPDWPLFLTAVERLPHLLFIVPNVTRLPELPNLVAVRARPAEPPGTTTTRPTAQPTARPTSQPTDRQAALAAAAQAADLLTDQPDLTSTALKAKLTFAKK